MECSPGENVQESDQNVISEIRWFKLFPLEMQHIRTWCLVQVYMPEDV